jgi:hypothetical protein
VIQQEIDPRARRQRRQPLEQQSVARSQAVMRRGVAWHSFVSAMKSSDDARLT